MKCIVYIILIRLYALLNQKLYLNLIYVYIVNDGDDEWYGMVWYDDDSSLYFYLY